MINKKINLELVTPEELLFSEDVDMVVIPGDKGDFGVLPDHSPLVAMMRPGVISIHNQGNDIKEIFITSGYADTSSEQCTILAEEAINVQDITEEMVKERMEASNTALRKAKTELETKKAEYSLYVSEAMEAVAN